jgi:hypothetical protein
MPVALKGSTSGQVTLDVPAAAGTNTLTLPAKTGNIITSADSGTVTGTMIASLPTGAVIQVVNSSPAAYASGTTLIPLDDTIPQITEGTEFVTATITPKSATSKLYILFSGSVYSSAAFTWTIGALFQDSTANALATVPSFITTAGAMTNLNISYYMTSGTTSATTFRVRIGPSASATVAINGINARLFGGSCSTTLTIIEIAA